MAMLYLLKWEPSTTARGLHDGTCHIMKIFTLVLAMLKKSDTHLNTPNRNRSIIQQDDCTGIKVQNKIKL
jgi:hypothetical protein